MNQFKSDKETRQALPYVFISIFYAREKWHELLPVIHDALSNGPGLKLRPAHYFIFFSTHRGSSIRLALQYEHPDQKYAYSEILNEVVAYIDRHPSISQRLQLPVTSFFLDFPNNSIHFNLFNESSIAPGALAQFQELLSQIMLQFFGDHAVDEEGIFTLLVWLQEAILNGLSNLDRSKLELISQITAQLNEKDTALELKPYQLEEADRFQELQAFTDDCNLENLFLQVELLTVLINDRLDRPIEVYFFLLRLMREHLLKLSDEIVFQSLQYLSSSVPVDDPV